MEKAKSHDRYTTHVVSIIALVIIHVNPKRDVILLSGLVGAIPWNRIIAQPLFLIHHVYPHCYQYGADDQVECYGFLQDQTA